MIPAGGARMPSTAETAIEREAGDGNLRSQDQFFMNGSEVFNFVQVEVPPLIDQLLAASGESKEAVDVFLFHQPNRFMLEKLADRLKVERAKLPNNVVENFGNASSVTIPTAIALNFGACLTQKRFRACLGGFGVGLTIAALLMDLGTMQKCELLEL